MSIEEFEKFRDRVSNTHLSDLPAMFDEIKAVCRANVTPKNYADLEEAAGKFLVPDNRRFVMAFLELTRQLKLYNP